VHQSVGPAEVRPLVLRELTDAVAKPLSSVSEQPWQSGEVPTGWKRGNMTPIFKWGEKAELGK